LQPPAIADDQVTVSEKFDDGNDDLSGNNSPKQRLPVDTNEQQYASVQHQLSNMTSTIGLVASNTVLPAHITSNENEPLQGSEIQKPPTVV
jgi:hypothetical protein